MRVRIIAVSTSPSGVRRTSVSAFSCYRQNSVSYVSREYSVIVLVCPPVLSSPLPTFRISHLRSLGHILIFPMTLRFNVWSTNSVPSLNDISSKPWVYPCLANYGNSQSSSVINGWLIVVVVIIHYGLG